MGTLHVVATPIGNLEDITLRALRVLREADRILAEDTRRTRILLRHHGVDTPLVSFHAHNEEARAEQVLGWLAEGASLALVSDAGTPLVSDPGGRLVAAALEAGHEVVAVPGASAVLAALAASGLPALPFACLGFPPRRRAARRALFAAWRARPETLVLFESPRRVATTLEDLHAELGARRAVVARELTKLHEELVRGTLPELARRFAGGARGEVTIVVEGAGAEAEAAPPDPAERDRALLEGLAAGSSPRELADRLAAAGLGRRRELYQRALGLRGGGAIRRDRSREPGPAAGAPAGDGSSPGAATAPGAAKRSGPGRGRPRRPGRGGRQTP